MPCAQSRPAASSIRASVVADATARMDDRARAANEPVSTVSARVKFAFTSSVVQADGLVERRHEGEAHRRVHQRHREAGMDDADRVVVVLGRLALEDRVTALGLDEPEAERLRDRRRRDLARRHQLHELEARAARHRVAEGERVVPRVRARALRAPARR